MRPTATAPSPTTRLARRRRALAAVLVLTAVAAGCGVDSSSEGLDTKGDGRTTTTIDETTTTVEEDPPCALEGDDEEEGDTAAAPGASDNCIPEPEPTTTTTEVVDPDPEPDPDPQPSGDEAEYVEALATGLVDLDEDDLPVTEDQAACIAPEWIDEVGVEALAGNDIAPGDLEDFELDEVFAPAIDRDTADAMVAAVVDCGIDLDAFVRQDGLDDGQTEDQMDCFFDALPDGAIADVLAASLDQGDDIAFDDPAIVALGEAYEECVPDPTAGS